MMSTYISSQSGHRVGSGCKRFSIATPQNSSSGKETAIELASVPSFILFWFVQQGQTWLFVNEPRDPPALDKIKAGSLC